MGPAVGGAVSAAKALGSAKRREVGRKKKPTFWECQLWPSHITQSILFFITILLVGY